MTGLVKQHRRRGRAAPGLWPDARGYAEAEGHILESPELEKLSLAQELYEREQRGFSMHKNEEAQEENKLFARLGALMGVPPDLKFMGEFEHSTPR